MLRGVEGNRRAVKVPQIAANKGRDDAKIVREEALSFEADNVAEVGHVRDEVGDLTKRIRQYAASDAAVWMELAAVHAKLELYKVNDVFLREVLMMRC